MKILIDAISLSSGTIASLTGIADYARIEKIQRAFFNFVILHPGKHRDWMEAWFHFISEDVWPYFVREGV
jgi:hypothetical protein